MSAKALATSLLFASSLAAISSAAFAETKQPAPFQFDKPAAADKEITAPQQRDLRRIIASQFDLFFGGEYTSRSFSFFALPDEVNGDAKLVLNLQTAISVAPEDSKLNVSVNGIEVGTVELHAGSPRTLELTVPAGTVQPGYNAVSFTANHLHRVDCGIDATYELWTKIDPKRSGFAFSGERRATPTVVDLMTMSGIDDGKTPLRVIMTKDAQRSEYDRALKVVQALSIMGNFDRPRVEFSNDAGSGPGIDIYIGTRAQLAESLNSQHRALQSREQLVVDATATGRQQLILTGDNAQALDMEVGEFVSQAVDEQPVGTAEGLSALVNSKGISMAPGQRTTLKELGFQSTRFSGRHFLSQLNFTMPSDFYPGEYGNMDFYLSALYAGGLVPGAELVVKANDKVVASLPLNSNHDGEIRDQRLPIPFSALRPGQNTFLIEARLPTRKDQTCESVAMATSNIRLAIRDSSYFDVENYARVGRFPDLAGLSSGFANTAEREKSTYLFTPDGDRQAMNAAATFISKIAYVSRRLQKVEFTSVLPVGNDVNMIAFGSYEDMPTELMSRMGLDVFSVRTASISTPYEVASLDMMPIDADAAKKALDDKAKLEGTRDLATYADAFLRAPTHEASALLTDAKTGIARQLASLNLKYLPTLLGEERDESLAPNSNASLVVAQHSTSNKDAWTMIASRKDGDVAAQAELLTASNVWNRLGGSVQSFSMTGQVLDQQFGKEEYLYQTQPLTFGNARLVAAGWLANNAEIYVGALLSAAILLGLGTFMVLITGRRGRHGG